MKSVTEVILWLFVGALVVLVVTHPRGFATAVTAVGGQINNSATLLTGASQPENSGGAISAGGPGAGYQIGGARAVLA